jgi:ankyrin repeat protein
MEKTADPWWRKEIPGSERGLWKVVSKRECKERGVIFYRRDLEFPLGQVVCDPNPWSTKKDCSPGGIYGTILDHLPLYSFNGFFGEWICRVELPPGTRIHLEERKWKVDKLMLFEPKRVDEFFLDSMHPERFSVFISHVPDSDGHWGLEWLMMNGHFDVALHLLKDPRVNPARNRQYPFRMACQKGLPEIVSHLLQDSRIDPAHDQCLGLRLACQQGNQGHLSVAEMLMKHPGVDPSLHGQQCLRVATESGLLSIVELLLRDSRVDPSWDHSYPLRGASRLGYVRLVELFLQDPRTDPASLDQEALRSACEHGHFLIVQLLLQHPRTDPRVLDGQALRDASCNGHQAIVDLLLQDPRTDPSALDRNPPKSPCILQ